VKGNDLYAWGHNSNGQLGDGTTQDKHSPIYIGSGYTQIAAGDVHSLALKGGDLYAWGQNSYRQLGDGTTEDKHTPIEIGTGFTQIAAGDLSSFALKGNDLYAWGYNAVGLLGDGTNRGRSKPVKIGSGFSQIAAGDYHSLALKDGDLYASGYNSYGQLGNGTTKERNKYVKIGSGFTQITAGDHYSLALKDGELYVWGRQSDDTSFLTPTKIPPRKVGDILTFGSYGGEPIQWRVLAVENGKTLVISEKILDAQPYHTNRVNITWAKSAIRTWLNKNFYQSAFTAEERKRIADTNVVNSKNAAYGTAGGGNTKDKIFLFSLDEARTYFTDNADRIAYVTTHAKQQGCNVVSTGAGWWWLRSPGRSSNYAANVTYNGYVTGLGYYVTRELGGVRPALWLNP